MVLVPVESHRLIEVSQLHRHLHHNLLHRGADTAGSQAGLVGILREDQEEVPVADDRVHSRAVGIPRRVLRLVVRNRLRDLRKRLAANEFRPLQGKLDVDVPPMGLIPLRVHQAGRVFAHHRLDPQVQQVRADLHVRLDGRNVIQRQVDGWREAFIEADFLDVVVNHDVYSIEKSLLLRRFKTFTPSIPSRLVNMAFPDSEFKV